MFALQGKEYKKTSEENQTIKPNCTRLMKTRRDRPTTIPGLAAALMLPLFCLLLASGCAGNKQYRTKPTVCADMTAPDFPQAMLERGTNYLLGFVEFDDQGWLWSREQMDTVLREVKKEMGPNQERGVLLLTFVHGWKNNAAYDNGNVQAFRTNLSFVADLEAKQARSYGVEPRKVVGVFAGWRGLTLESWVLKQTTFWGRKRTGHEVGRGALMELLLRLEALVNESKAAAKKSPGEWAVASRLIIVGHSFGAAATYSAVAPVYMERILMSHNGNSNSNGAVARGFGDLVVLVNPAFEAARFHVLRDAATNALPNVTNKQQLLNLAIFTSKGDTATKNLFPIGRFFSAMSQSHRTNGQYSANVKAVGHYGKFITHDLLHKPEQYTKRKSNYQRDPGQSQQIVQQRKADFQSAEKLQNALQGEMEFTSSRLKSRPRKPASPFIVAQVDKKLVPDHNKIWNPSFTGFLGEFMQLFAQDEREKAPK